MKFLLGENCYLLGGMNLWGEFFLVSGVRGFLYGFSLTALRLINDNLSNRKLGTKIENTYCTCLDIIFGVSQGSMLGPPLFNVCLTDLVFAAYDIDIASYADNNTPYMVADDVDDLITSLEQAANA